MRRLLFLDFDGVLHPVSTTPGTSLPFEWVAELAALLSQAQDVRIAVHSSWAQRFALEELRDFLGPLGSRLVGCVGPGPKAAAILQFVQATPGVQDWLVIDDEAGEFPVGFPGRMVICDSTHGISDQAVQSQVRSWLAQSSVPPSTHAT